MTALTKAAAGVFRPARLTRAMAGTALTAVLAVVFGLSVIVELSNAPDLAPRAELPADAVHAASDAVAPASYAAGEPSASF